MKRKKEKDPFELVDQAGHGVPFARLTDRQAKSRSWQNLSDGAKTTLSVCKLCRQYHKGDDKNGSRKIYDRPENFYFNRELQQRYGLKNPNKVRKSLIELIEAGFITVVEFGGYSRQKNIFAFSGNYLLCDAGGDFELTDTDKTFIKGRG